jgi:hypothetical protein
VTVSASKKSWLDAHIGWDPGGRVTETYWFGDPAIDQEKSDLGRYLENLEMDALAVRSGQKPVRIVVTLPSVAQFAEVRENLRASPDAAAVVAFAIAVRFPDMETPMQRHGGSTRLHNDFMMGLVTDRGGTGDSMVSTIGTWVISKCVMTDDEKKQLLQASTAKTSEPQGSTTAPAATTDDEACKDAPTPEAGQEPPAAASA